MNFKTGYAGNVRVALEGVDQTAEIKGASQFFENLPKYTSSSAIL